MARDLQNTANQGKQFYGLQQDTPMIYFAVLKESFGTLDRDVMYRKDVHLRNEGKQGSHQGSKANLCPCCRIYDFQINQKSLQ